MFNLSNVVGKTHRETLSVHLFRAFGILIILADVRLTLNPEVMCGDHSHHISMGWI